MEYQEEVRIEEYQPDFGYLHDPKEEEGLIDLLEKDGRIRTYRRQDAQTMPRPKGDPMRLLIVCGMLIAALVISVLIATMAQYRITV